MYVLSPWSFYLFKYCMSQLIILNIQVVSNSHKTVIILGGERQLKTKIWYISVYSLCFYEQSVFIKIRRTQLMKHAAVFPGNTVFVQIQFHLVSRIFAKNIKITYNYTNQETDLWCNIDRTHEVWLKRWQFNSVSAFVLLYALNYGFIVSQVLSVYSIIRIKQVNNHCFIHMT